MFESRKETIMKLFASKSQLKGRVKIPGSKSHTIRALVLASMAEGRSVLTDPLFSEDTKSCIRVMKKFGSRMEINLGEIIVDGFGKNPQIPEDVIDVGNSGTTLNIALGVSALINGTTVFTGDQQIRRRPVENLLRSLNQLGAECFSTRNNGYPPVVVRGPLKGGSTVLDAITSQYLTALLLACPLAPNPSSIKVPLLYEAPYVDMTLWWLQKQGIRYTRHQNDFEIYPNQAYHPFTQKIPGDFSSATFFAVLASIGQSEVFLQNLDMTDPQGDKEVLSLLKQMGANITFEKEGIRVCGGELQGIEIDMNAIPDALPAMAVLGCFAKGETRLIHVPQARLKETDRIAVMYEELTKMGADIKELPDGLVIRESRLRGCLVNGHFDHRIVMALAVAGMHAEGQTEILTAQAMDVTFPEFVDLAKKCGGNLRLEENDFA
jgi:3-phosphoshikimate 1-carboxyvinyltransferase